jgi:predicted amidophosphoribosyltransferase
VEGLMRLRRVVELKVCSGCGANRHVHRGLCRACRRRAQGEGVPVPEEDERLPTQPELDRFGHIGALERW